MAEKAKTIKRPVNLSLNQDLVAEARSVTDNPSETVESALADFVSRERARRVAHAQALEEAIVTWNTFAEKHGSFADEHSTL
jgi:post-segregation antitoxin (ccd killing protein)